MSTAGTGPGPEGAQPWTQPQAQPWTGPWADDARRIFEIVQGHLGQPAGGAGTGAAGDSTPGLPTAGHPTPGQPTAGHPPECAYCPICQGVALIRRSGPETLDRIAELAAGLAATLRATDPGHRPVDEPAVDQPAAGWPRGPAPAGHRPTAPTTESAAARPATPPTTERIDISE